MCVCSCFSVVDSIWLEMNGIMLMCRWVVCLVVMVFILWVRWLRFLIIVFVCLSMIVLSVVGCMLCDECLNSGVLNMFFSLDSVFVMVGWLLVMCLVICVSDLCCWICSNSIRCWIFRCVLSCLIMLFVLKFIDWLCIYYEKVMG